MVRSPCEHLQKNFSSFILSLSSHQKINLQTKAFTVQYTEQPQNLQMFVLSLECFVATTHYYV